MPYITKQQQAVLRCLKERENQALSAGELAQALRLSGCSVGLATVYRQLEKLAQEGTIHKIATQDGALYQYCPHPEDHQSCFLIRCSTCGKVIHLDCAHLQALRLHLQAAHHFQMDPRQTILTGLCADCQQREERHGS